MTGFKHRLIHIAVCDIPGFLFVTRDLTGPRAFQKER